MQLFQGKWDKDDSPTFAQFYLLAKVHKVPLKTRPIVSVSSCITEAIGKWVDVHLQNLFRHHRHCFPYFLKSSNELVAEIQNMQVPFNACLFTCDAISMYTNIDTHHAFEVIEAFISSLPQDDIHPGLLTGLKIVMLHCVFQFGSEYFVQLSGTAMGAPPAPMYATMYFALHESIIMPNYASNLLYYRRFIDDGLGIWLNTNDQTFEQFQTDMNQFGRLRWEFSTLQTTADFLDVHLEIQNLRITTCMHEKALNLYLYLPPHSAHPPGVLKSLIFGRLRQIHILCGEQEDKNKFIHLLFQRLLVRGYSADTLNPIFRDALSSINRPDLPRNNANMKKDLFLHVHYHPANPSSNDIQNIFYRTLVRGQDGFTCQHICNHEGNVFSTDRLIVAYHRPKNLGNRFSNRLLKFQRGVYGQFLFDNS